LPTADSFTSWTSLLKDVLFIPNHDLTSIYYLDEEGDRIRITCDLELEEFFLIADCLDNLRLEVESSNSSSPVLAISFSDLEIEKKEEIWTETSNLMDFLPAKIIHSVSCEHCHHQIEGIRFKCINCETNYNLCEDCENAGVHPPDHLFVKIRNTLPSENNWSLPNFYDQKDLLKERKEAKLKEKQRKLKQKQIQWEAKQKEKEQRNKEKRTQDMSNMYLRIETLERKLQELSSLPPPETQMERKQMKKLNRLVKRAEKRGAVLEKHSQVNHVPEQPPVEEEKQENLQRLEDNFPYPAELKMLQEMGFSDTQKLSELLLFHSGHFDAVFSELL